MLKDLKQFLLRGNVVDLAVAVVVAAAFGAVVNALVEDLITPLIAIPGTVDFSDLKFSIQEDEFTYGHFLNVLIAFLTISTAVFFLVVRPVNALMTRRKTEPEVDSSTKECGYCLHLDSGRRRRLRLLLRPRRRRRLSDYCSTAAGTDLRNTSSSAISWSLRLLRCEARRRTSNASSEEISLCAMRMPLAWPITSRRSRAMVRLRARSVALRRAVALASVMAA